MAKRRVLTVNCTSRVRKILNSCKKLELLHLTTPIDCEGEYEERLRQADVLIVGAILSGDALLRSMEPLIRLTKKALEMKLRRSFAVIVVCEEDELVLGFDPEVIHATPTDLLVVLTENLRGARRA